ncbi:DeoR/GlpR transcriptional regulator [Cryobacterium frigoriphilum]|uniref:Lactose phosphotransferase system repressor n=1 Tax=Cryobacterium frigoriphilum TaxID=1259150 RepID=A0A4R8ZUD4_9MICO|nr:DeoR/GlpR family DNA-binding transcription regulator [Cryobacterium frigoriphilum]TFD45924.1 DeoR/GlpR transcriptional regulator [Cryobacterium frigoriphilum]
MSRTTEGETAAGATTPGRQALARHEQILSALDLAGRVEVGELSESLGVAEETIRRDLRVLEEAGQLRRAHGGAIAAADPVTDPTFITDPEPSAHPVATLAARLLPATGVIFLDSGPIAEALAALVPDDAAVQLVTPSIPVALIASRNSALVVYNLGGTVDPADDSQSGQWARESLEHIRIDVAFITVTGLTSDGHLLAANPKAAIVKSAAIAAAERVVLIADHDRLASVGLVKFARLADLDHLVVDDRTSEAVLALAADAGVPVLIAPTLEQTVEPHQHEPNDPHLTDPNATNLSLENPSPAHQKA